MWYVITHDSLVIFSKHVDVETMFFGFPSQGGMGGTNQVITYVNHNSKEGLLND